MYTVTITQHDGTVEMATTEVFDVEEDAWAYVDHWAKNYRPRLAVVNLSEPLVRRHDVPQEGCDRCACGAKYWDLNAPHGWVCHSCGERWSGVSA